MSTLNLFIVEDNASLANSLQQFLETKFGDELNISKFTNGESALQKVDSSTNIVLLDCDLNNIKGNEVLKKIKQINGKTEVIMLTSNGDIEIAINAFKNGATDYVVKGKNSFGKIRLLVEQIVTYPIKFLVREMKISKFLAIFLLTFIIMGIVVLLVYQYVANF
jgi:DNA-binding NtrC family response regulator